MLNEPSERVARAAKGQGSPGKDDTDGGAVLNEIVLDFCLKDSRERTKTKLRQSGNLD